jgi:hypothetical protein
MGNAKHIEILKQGVEAWNAWRKNNFKIRPDFRDIDIVAELTHTGPLLNDCVVNMRYANFYRGDFRGANLARVELTCADLRQADLSGANISGARLYGVELNAGILPRASLIDTCLFKADLTVTDMTEADLTMADLSFANLTWAKLTRAVLSSTILHETLMADTDLTDAVGLSSCDHKGYSVIDHRTLAKSGVLPIPFLRGCGLPNAIIDCVSELRGAPVHFPTCFISYSHQDVDFATQLHSSLQEYGIRCWFAPEDMQGGKKIHTQINEAIRTHEKLILVLSDHSMQSDWVVHEIKQALVREKEQNTQILFPVALCDYDRIRTWKLFHPATITDLAEEVREYFILDFSNWRDVHAYWKILDQLLESLKASS